MSDKPKKLASDPWKGPFAVCPVTKRQHPAWMLYCTSCNHGKGDTGKSVRSGS